MMASNWLVRQRANNPAADHTNGRQSPRFGFSTHKSCYKLYCLIIHVLFFVIFSLLIVIYSLATYKKGILLLQSGFTDNQDSLYFSKNSPKMIYLICVTLK